MGKIKGVEIKELQSYLLEMLVEIDSLCRENNIKYYLAGGNIIGAVRHGGFIPWDDDIDVYMTRDDFMRFREAFNEKKLENRAIASPFDNENFPALICHYVNTATTSMTRTNCLNDFANGLFIDVFILDPIADDCDVDKRRALLNIYTDLTNSYFPHSVRNRKQDLGLYEEYLDKVKEDGLKNVLKNLEDELFTTPEKEANRYMVRWATAPHIFDKDMYGEPVEYEYEGHMFYLPAKWYDCLTQLFGEDWVNIPDDITEREHTYLIDCEKPGSEYRKLIDPLIDKEEARRKIKDTKIAAIKNEKHKREISLWQLENFKRLAIFLHGKRIAGENVKELYNNKSYDKILELFKVYLDFQTKPAFVGSYNFFDTRKLYYPSIIEINDEELEILLYSSIYENKLALARKILNAIKYEKGLNEKLIRVEKLLENVALLKKAYFFKEYDKCNEILLSFDSDIKKTKAISGMAFDILNKDDYSDEIIKKARNLYAETKEDIYLKVVGDKLYDKGKIEEAKSVFSELSKITRNGCYLEEIKKRFGIVVEVKNVIRDASEITEEGKVQLKLLDEIKDICEKKHIDFIVSAKMTEYAEEYKTLNPNLNQNFILVKAKDSKKIKTAILESLTANRSLKTEHDIDYPLCIEYRYGAKNTVDMSFRDGLFKEEKEIDVAIKFLSYTSIYNGLVNKILALIKETGYNVKPVGKKKKAVSKIIKIFKGKTLRMMLYKSKIAFSRINLGSKNLYFEWLKNSMKIKVYQIDKMTFKERGNIKVKNILFPCMQEDKINDFDFNTKSEYQTSRVVHANISIEEINEILDLDNPYIKSEYEKHLTRKNIYGRKIRKRNEYWKLCTEQFDLKQDEEDKEDGGELQ